MIDRCGPTGLFLMGKLIRPSERLRIAYLINSVEGGGAALPVPRIVEALATHGASVRVFALTRRDGRALPAFERAGLSVTIRDGGERDHRSAYRWIGQMLDDYRPEILWTSLTRATLLGQRAAQSRGVPVVSWQHAAYLRPGNAFLLKRQRRLSAMWIADSDHVASFARKHLGVTDDRLITWPIFAADPSVPQSSEWQAGRSLAIGSLGRLHPVKGYDLLIDAIGMLLAGGFRAPVQWRLTIAGDGDERARLSRKIATISSANVVLAPFADDPASFLAGLHAYVQPSRSEGFCIAAHEAMQAGLPVLASKVGELSNSIEPGHSGWLVRHGDVEELADGLFAMLSEPHRLRGLGQNARKRVLALYGHDRFTTTAGTILDKLVAIVQARPRANGLPSSRSS